MEQSNEDSRNMEARGWDDVFWEEIGLGDLVDGNHAKIGTTCLSSSSSFLYTFCQSATLIEITSSTILTYIFFLVVRAPKISSFNIKILITFTC